MGKAIQIQNAYIEKGFRNHTTIASVINYHLFKHRAPLSMFTSLDKSIKDLHTWKSQIARDVKKLEAKSNTAWLSEVGENVVPVGPKVNLSLATTNKTGKYQIIL